MKNRLTKIFTILILAALSLPVYAQVESSIILNRGKLWHTLSYGKSGPSFSNWARRGIGLDWPGFDASRIAENIGGEASYMVSGGIYVGAKKFRDSVMSVEDWSLYAGSITENSGGKYVVTKHRHLYPDGENWWNKTDSKAGEEVVETVWEYNIVHDNDYDVQRMLPIRVIRRAHQWSGSRDDENYIIYDYQIINISEEIKSKVPADRFVADSLFDFRILVNYGLHCNSRSWNVLFPSLSAGARNTWFNYLSSMKMMYGWADDYPLTPEKNESFGLASSFGITGNGETSGEYLAPAMVGVKLLYSSRDKNGLETNVNQYGWSAASNSIDLSGPFTNIGALESQYAVLEDIRLAANFVSSIADTTFMKKSRMWSMMSLGPWDIAPGDTIRFVLAEIVNGIDYSIAVDPDNYPFNTAYSRTQQIFLQTANRSQMTFDNGFDHPDPPAAPEFTVDYNREVERVQNVLEWGTDAENIPDPDDGQYDLQGYIIYRSSFLTIGPWNVVDTITKGDTDYFDGVNYTYVDSAVAVGQSYYYSITSFDNGRANWSVNPSVSVDPMESSIFANRKVEPFVATLPPKADVNQILVVPNPYVIGEGYTSPGSGDNIQFVNIPNPCTIRIFTVRGDLVKTIDVPEGYGAIVEWDQVTDFGQYVESGIYVYHVESPYGDKTGKLAIVR